MKKKGQYVFTTDTDWCTENALSTMLQWFEREGVPLTVFATNEYECLKDYPKELIGIHPNFMQDSTQGGSYFEVLDYLKELYPEAVSFRCHRYYENSIVMEELHRKGFLYCSNLCTKYQAGIQPLVHYTGIVRFPVFFEDDMDNVTWHVFQSNIYGKGIKIFSFHPSNLESNKTLLSFTLKQFGSKAVSLDKVYRDYISKCGD